MPCTCNKVCGSVPPTTNNTPEVTKAGREMFQLWWTHGNCCWESLSEALSAAGLLRTDLHERALEACEAYCRAYRGHSVYSEGHLVAEVGRAILVSRKPVVPVYRADGRVVRLEPARPHADAIVCPDSLTAERVAKALNAQESAK